MSRREDILGVARDLFLASGIRGVTLRAVATRLHISAPAIYRHFDGKDDLMRQVVDVGRERFATYLVRGLSGRTPRERLLLTGESYLDFAFEQPRDYQIMFSSWDELQVGVHAPPPAGPAPTFQFLLDRVRECLPQERAGDPKQVFEYGLLFWAQCHGLATLYLSGGGRDLMPLAEYRALCQRLLQRSLTAALG